MCLPVIFLSLAFCFLPVDIIHTDTSITKLSHVLKSNYHAVTQQNSEFSFSVRRTEYSYLQAWRRHLVPSSLMTV